MENQENTKVFGLCLEDQRRPVEEVALASIPQDVTSPIQSVSGLSMVGILHPPPDHLASHRQGIQLCKPEQIMSKEKWVGSKTNMGTWV